MLNFSKSDSSASEDKLLEEEIAQSGKSELPFYFFYLGIILGAAALSFITSGSPNAFSFYLPILIFLILILISIATVFTGSYRYSKNFQNRLNKFFSAFLFILGLLAIGAGVFFVTCGGVFLFNSNIIRLCIMVNAGSLGLLSIISWTLGNTFTNGKKILYQRGSIILGIVYVSLVTSVLIGQDIPNRSLTSFFSFFVAGALFLMILTLIPKPVKTTVDKVLIIIGLVGIIFGMIILTKFF